MARSRARCQPEDDFVLILIGHGSADGVEYKFNLVGPDISAASLAALCNRVAAKRQPIVNATSSSGGSIPAFQRAGRAVIASTKSGTEKNATVFARYFVEALQDPAADVDKNESVSALEAFQYAERKTNEYYTSQKRLATEHAVFGDTGKGEPVRAAAADIGEGRLLASLTLVRFGEAQKAALDPAKRDLLAKKEDFERQIDVLKYQKAAMSQTEYDQQLKALLVGLARVQAAMDKDDAELEAGVRGNRIGRQQRRWPRGVSRRDCAALCRQGRAEAQACYQSLTLADLISAPGDWP
jgi:hypothetical protein